MEFESRELPRLQPVTRRLIHDRRIHWSASGPSHRRAPRQRRTRLLPRSISDADADVIAVAPGELQFIDHLIGHELGHIRQFETVPFSECFCSSTSECGSSPTRSGAITLHRRPLHWAAGHDVRRRRPGRPDSARSLRIRRRTSKSNDSSLVNLRRAHCRSVHSETRFNARSRFCPQPTSTKHARRCLARVGRHDLCPALRSGA